MPSRACARSPVTCCSASPITRWSGRWSMSPSAISVRIAVGQPVTVKARSFPGREFPGKISVIYPQVNRETRTARVRIELPNPDRRLAARHVCRRRHRHRQSGAGSRRSRERGSRYRRAGRPSWSTRAQGRFEPRDVKLGHRGDGYVEIREGIADGEPVVVSANFLIDAESNLKAALKGFSEAGGQP